MTSCVWATDADHRDAIEQSIRDGKGLSLLQGAPRCDLDKSWHAIHYILTGTADEGELPVGYLLHGGEFLREPDPDDELDEPPRWLAPSEVQQFNQVLQQIDGDEFSQRFDAEEMVDAGVYSISTEYADDHLETVQDHYTSLRSLVSGAAQNSQALIITAS